MENSSEMKISLEGKLLKKRKKALWRFNIFLDGLRYQEQQKNKDPHKYKKSIHSNIIRILALYVRYTEAQTNLYIIDSTTQDLDRIRRLSHKALSSLKIDLPIEEIESIFEKSGVIQLRKTDTSTKLLLGCGNKPCDPKFSKVDPHKHDHSDFVTINPEFCMNPTVIGAFGVNLGLNSILPHHFYHHLYGENVTLANDSQLVGFDKSALNCLKHDFKAFQLEDSGEISEGQEFLKSDFLYNPDETPSQQDEVSKSDEFEQSEMDSYIDALDILESDNEFELEDSKTRNEGSNAKIEGSESSSETMLSEPKPWVIQYKSRLGDELKKLMMIDDDPSTGNFAPSANYLKEHPESLEQCELDEEDIIAFLEDLKWYAEEGANKPDKVLLDILNSYMDKHHITLSTSHKKKF